MIFWIVCAVLTVVAVVLTLRPVMQDAQHDGVPQQSDLEVYKDQLAEVDRDIARGLLTVDEAEAARIEISRRILAVSSGEAEPGDRAASTPQSSIVFYACAALIVASSLGFYLVLGSPGYGGRPFAERISQPPASVPVQELIARVEARLREAPNDGQGWDVVAPVYLKQGRNRDAARAFSQAIALLGENRARLRGLAEAHLAASNGIVGREVRDAYRKILIKEPNLIAPRFWLAVGLEQDGKRKEAAAAYQALLRAETDDQKPQRLPPPLRRLIVERLSAVTGKPVAKAAPSLPDAGKGPPPPAGMSASMPAKERAAMIEQMVSGLAERLKENGGSQQEWQRLIRAYSVLGRRKQAAAALDRAKKQFANDTIVGQQLDDFARQLGLEPVDR